MAKAKLATRPKRWDQPFGPGRLRPDIVARILSIPLFRSVDSTLFPDELALHDIIASDGRINSYDRGDLIYRKGEYGTSVFVVLSGGVRLLASKRGERVILESKPSNPGHGSTGSGNNNVSSDAEEHRFSSIGGKIPRSLSGLSQRLYSFSKQESIPKKVEDVDAIVSSFSTIGIGVGGMFGEAAALTRCAHSQSVFAEDDGTHILEIRWPCVREIRHWSDPFRFGMDELYRSRALQFALRDIDLFKKLDNEQRLDLSRHARLDLHGEFEWTHNYQRFVQMNGSVDQVHEREPFIVEEGDYFDDVFFVRSGFARVSERVDQGERTLSCLGAGDTFGLEEMLSGDAFPGGRRFQKSLRAMGYVAVLKIPAAILSRHLGPTPELLQAAMALEERAFKPRAPRVQNRGGAAGGGLESYDQGTLDFVVDHRFLNGAEAMAINVDRCVNCDDCVRACASTHGNVPRFVRSGARQHNLMVAHACMHCADPVCLIGCPTNAIARERASGSVVVDEATCVGCGTCASNCPYGNIRMEPAKDSSGALLIDGDGLEILKAVKCDLCAGQQGGPACQRACPHDALIRVNIKDASRLSAWLVKA